MRQTPIPETFSTASCHCQAYPSSFILTRISLVRRIRREAEILSSIFWTGKKKNLVVESYLPPVVGRCLDLEIVHTVHTGLVTKLGTDLVHIKLKHFLSVDTNDSRIPCDAHSRLLAHQFGNKIALDAGAHRYTAEVGRLTLELKRV